MTKMTRPEIVSYRIKASCKVYRKTSNTGGTIIIGIGWHTAGGTATAAANARINLDNVTVDKWTTFEFYFLPESITWGNPMVGLVEIDYADPLTGDGAYVADLLVEETQNSPGVPQKTASAQYDLNPEDNGKHIYISTGGVRIPANSTTPIPIDFCVTIVNNSGLAQTISKNGTLTLNKATTGAVTSLTLAAYGMCTLLKVGTDTWNASGAI